MCLCMRVCVCVFVYVCVFLGKLYSVKIIEEILILTRT